MKALRMAVLGAFAFLNNSIGSGAGEKSEGIECCARSFDTF